MLTGPGSCDCYVGVDRHISGVLLFTAIPPVEGEAISAGRIAGEVECAATGDRIALAGHIRDVAAVGVQGDGIFPGCVNTDIAIDCGAGREGGAVVSPLVKGRTGLGRIGRHRRRDHGFGSIDGTSANDRCSMHLRAAVIEGNRVGVVINVAS